MYVLYNCIIYIFYINFISPSFINIKFKNYYRIMPEVGVRSMVLSSSFTCFRVKMEK